jgi:hypothetical protein
MRIVDFPAEHYLYAFSSFDKCAQFGIDRIPNITKYIAWNEARLAAPGFRVFTR